jgi:hypothetical protein
VLIYEHPFYKTGNRLIAAKSSPRHGSRDPINAAARDARAWGWVVPSAWQRVSHPVVLTSSDDVADCRCNMLGAILTRRPRWRSAAVNLGYDGHGPWCLTCRRWCHNWIGPGPRVDDGASTGLASGPGVSGIALVSAVKQLFCYITTATGLYEQCSPSGITSHSCLPSRITSHSCIRSWWLQSPGLHPVN